ncbi:hypothetical protein CP532_6648 [Ophiocordyceps camponoti-leonardi (nom. inval.)]|nr:hypothetical protein CP532_6648 [Ophiocordyceps camponoti-leonardi (nom. inval.)]
MPSPSANSLPPHRDDPDVLAFCIVMTVVTVFCITLRFSSRAIAVELPRTRPRFQLDDWFALAAVPFIIAQLGISFAAIHEGYGRYLALLPASSLLRIAQYQFIIFFLYNAGLFFTKASALAFLRRIFIAQTSPTWFNVCLWIGHGANLAWFIGIVFGTIFICHPIRKNWEDSVPGYCGETSSLFMGSSVPGVIIDLFILVLPLPRLLGLRVNLCRKIGIMVVFILGYCVVVLSLGRMITVIKSETAMSTDLPYAGVPVVYWVTAEPAISLMVVCLPAMLPLGRLIMNNYFSPLSNMVLSRSGRGSRSPRGKPGDLDSDFEFGGGDELFDGGDELLAAIDAQKRKQPDDDEDPDTPSKRQKANELHGAVARRILTEKFGHASFNHKQESAIASVLAGKNTLVIFPTGAGKSLCYQIPAVALEELDKLDGSREPGQSGISIVVSPLIALMKDQVDALRRRGIPVDYMNSTKTQEAERLTRVAMQKGQVRLLYCAPERLSNESFIENIKTVPGGVRLVAVDEAHCISEWGHSFRPEYLKVARFAEEIKAERVICLTATATPKVADDVSKAFKIDAPSIFRTSPYRPNLHLHVEPVNSKHDKYERIFAFLRMHPGPSLIYVTLQAQAENLAQDLVGQGFKAQAFHAGMRTEVKQKIQDDFMADKIPIVCATIAFGMGIDKQDIRNIIHFDIPATVEEYTQQIGRAGRDGKVSHCLLYICHEDFYLRENFARGDLPSRRSVKALLGEVFNETAILSPVDGVITANHYAQSRVFDIRASPLTVIYASLELRFGLIRAITPEFSHYSFEATNKYEKVMKRDNSEEAKAILANATKKAKYYYLDMSGVVDGTGLLRTDLVRKLNQLEEQGCMKLKASGIQHRYRILKPVPSTEKSFAKLFDELYADLEFREGEALRRVHQMADLATGSKCLALALAEHFGMGLPDGKTKCGHCTYCVSGRRVVMPPGSFKPLTRAEIEPVLKTCTVRDDARFLARVAFGIKSPRVTQLKLDKSSVFRSLANHDFRELLKAFTDVCNKECPELST